jgi:glutathione S-transferase
LADSSNILRYIDAARGGGHLYPKDEALRQEVEDLEKCFDRDLGPHTRRWVYCHLLPERQVLVQVWRDGAPRVEALLIPFVMPIARRLLRRGYKITQDGAARSLDRLKSVFESVEARLATGGPYLVGEAFTAADLTFSSLAAPVLLPSECRAALPALERVSSEMRDQIELLRETDAGQFALGLYRRERHIVVTMGEATAN